MYNIDDAIAKIDGYVISVSGGGPFVGESKLIRIDEVKRTAAYASIVTGNGVPDAPAAKKAEVAVAAAEEEPDDEGAEEDGAKLQSNGSASRRRRGRRGGRRRSGARGSSSSGS
jgi:ribonuclease G